MSKAFPAETRRVTKRLAMCLTGCALVWWFMHVHREWVWVYFATLQGYEAVPAELSQVALAGISAITTIAITGITGIVGIVLFLVTGNVAVLRAFQFASIGQASAGVSSAAQALAEKRESLEVIEHIEVDESARNENLREHREEAE